MSLDRWDRRHDMVFTVKVKRKQSVPFLHPLVYISRPGRSWQTNLVAIFRPTDDELVVSKSRPELSLHLTVEAMRAMGPRGQYLIGVRVGAPGPSVGQPFVEIRVEFT